MVEGTHVLVCSDCRAELVGLGGEVATAHRQIELGYSCDLPHETVLRPQATGAVSVTGEILRRRSLALMNRKILLAAPSDPDLSPLETAKMAIGMVSVGASRESVSEAIETVRLTYAVAKGL